MAAVLKIVSVDVVETCPVCESDFVETVDVFIDEIKKVPVTCKECGIDFYVSASLELDTWTTLL